MRDRRRETLSRLATHHEDRHSLLLLEYRMSGAPEMRIGTNPALRDGRSRLNKKRITRPSARSRWKFGALLESFVFSEVLRLMTASDLRLTPHHFRDRDMREVDIVLERDDGTIAGIEVKASAVKAGDFGGLRALAEACGDRFAFGVVLYDSTDVVPFGDRLAAVPLSALWL
jgi:predicted AAA+ superfamily ATPase